MKIRLHRWLGVAVAWLGITSASAYDFQADGIYYDINSDETSVTVTNETGDVQAESYSGDVVIPSSVTHDGKNYSVTTIGDCAFRGCIDLTSVTIPESVTLIYPLPFQGCWSLQSIAVAENNPYFSSSEGVFFDKEKTRLIQYPAKKEDAYYIIPNSVTSIEESAFQDCTGLTTITIPNSVSYIGRIAFVGCTSLTSIAIPESVRFIEDQTFYGCSKLTSVTIPGSVTTIEGSAFFGCYGLTEVIIPNSVTTIGDYAFLYCDLLETIKSYAEVPPVIGAYTFSNYNATLHVSVDCGEAYRGAEYWANFTNIVESIDSRVEALQDEKTRVYMVGNTLHVENGGKVYQVYTLTGQPVYTGDDTTMQLNCPGIYIVCTGKRSQKVIVR